MYLQTVPALTEPEALVIILMIVLVTVINYQDLKWIAFHLVMCMTCPDQQLIIIIKAARQLSWMHAILLTIKYFMGNVIMYGVRRG